MLEQRTMRQLLILAYLVVPRLAIAQCPTSIGAFGAGWINLLLTGLRSSIDRAFTPIFACLFVVVCIIAAFETGRAGIQPGRNETRNPKPGTPAGLNHPHRMGIV